MQSCSINECQRSIALGVVLPILLCLLVYAAIFIYIIHQTYQENSVDIQNWEKMQIDALNQRTQDAINALRTEMANL